ncbi:hypothetical protein ACE6H2_016610 [Prunus campanulata]
MKGGRKNLKRAVEEESLTLKDGHSIMQVVSLRGSNLIEVGIGGAFDWEFDNAARLILQELGMLDSAPSSGLVKLYSMTRRKGPF